MPDQLISEYLQEALLERPKALAPDVLVAESNHRIANNLALIAGLVRLQAAGISRAAVPLSAAEARAALEEAGNRIETVGRLHRLLAARDGDGALYLNDYLRDVADATVSSMAPLGATSLRYASTGDCLVPTRQALPVGFIVGELVTNAIKYAHPTGVPGVIELGCHPDPRGATLVEVADDGVGLPEGFDTARDGGLGLRMARGLASQLGASLDFVAGGLGLRVMLALPPLLDT